MASTEEFRGHWKVLNKAFSEAWNKAMDAQAVVLTAQSAALAGVGRGPTEEQLEDARTSLDTANRMRRELEMLMRKMFGEPNL